MNYLIIHNGEPFYTDWFMAENNFVQGMIVINLRQAEYTIDGTTWIQIKQDNL